MTNAKRDSREAVPFDIHFKGSILPETAGVVAVVLAEDVVLAGEDGVEGDARDGGDGEAGESDGRAAHMEGDAAGEAQAADQDGGGDDQVAGVGEVHLVLHQVAHADGGDHAVEDKAHAADDGGGDGADEGGEQRREGQHQGVNSGQTDDLGIIDPAEHQHAGVLAIGGVGGAAEHACQGGGDAVGRGPRPSMLFEMMTLSTVTCSE